MGPRSCQPACDQLPRQDLAKRWIFPKAVREHVGLPRSLQGRRDWDRSREHLQRLGSPRYSIPFNCLLLQRTRPSLPFPHQRSRSLMPASRLFADSQTLPSQRSSQGVSVRVCPFPLRCASFPLHPSFSHSLFSSFLSHREKLMVRPQGEENREASGCSPISLNSRGSTGAFGAEREPVHTEEGRAKQDRTAGWTCLPHPLNAYGAKDETEVSRWPSAWGDPPVAPQRWSPGSLDFLG